MLLAQPTTSWESLDDDASESERVERTREREGERESADTPSLCVYACALIYVFAHLYTYVHTHTFTHACVYARTHTTSPRIQREGSKDIVSISALVTIPDFSLCPFFLRIFFFGELFNFRYSNFQKFRFQS